MKKSTLLIIPAVALLVFSAVESASAALGYVSEDFGASVATGSLDVELVENGQLINSGDKLLTGLLEEGQTFKIGQSYKEEIAVKNTGAYDAYVRVILTRSWKNEDGSKNTALDPSLIDLSINSSEWIINEEESTAEQLVLYSTSPLAAGELSTNVINALSVKNDVTTKVTKSGTTGNITTSYDYTGKSFCIEAEADGIQTHDAANAIYSAWGLTTTISDEGKMSFSDEVVSNSDGVISNDTDWVVSFNGDKITCNFESDVIADSIKDAMPGDTISYDINIENKDKNNARWYMTNDVIKSLEDDTNASGGAYSYKLSYINAKGDETVLFNSDTIGGDDASIQGLHQATDSTKNYFYLDELEKAESGKVNLTITLDGKTQDNAYQEALASLQMNFAVEKVSSGEKKNEKDDDPKDPKKPDDDVIKPKTGDSNRMLYSVIALAGGLALVGAWFVLNKNSKKEEA